MATIYFTSGTTGKPKGAMSSQFSVINNIRVARVNKLGVSDEEEMTTLIPLPFFHVYAGMIGIFSLATGPSTIVINDVKYSAKGVVECISRHKCTDLWTVPTMLVDIQNFLKKRKGSYDVSSILRVGCGAAPVPVEVVKESEELFPSLKSVIVGYGATETSAVATYPTPGTPQEIVCETVGTPQDFTQVKIVDSQTGKIVKHGETGEVLIKGFSIMKGYLEDEEKTNESIKDGWYLSGDLGTMDSHGRFKIVGRTKEMIIRGGENIYPREVEELLHEHPDILEVAVCGVPHPKLGEEVCAWVQLVDPNNCKITAEDIREFCRSRITYFKVPQHVFFVDSFPVTGSGKFQKFVMTEKSIEMLKDSQQRKQHN
jgi:fatty-acyl-CoA synthase